MQDHLPPIEDNLPRPFISLDEVLARVAEVSGAENDADISRALGAGRSSVATWRSRGTIPFEAIAAFAHAKGLSINWLLFGGGNYRNDQLARGDVGGFVSERFNRLVDFAATEARTIRVSWMDREYTVDPADYRWVPLLNVRVAGGYGKDASNEQIVGFNAWRKDWLEKKGLTDSVLSEVIVDGKSMEPTLRDGEAVLVDHSASEITGGDIYVLRLGADLVVKYVQLMPDGRLQVTSENSHAFPPYYIEESELGNNVEIIGRVVPRGLKR